MTRPWYRNEDWLAVALGGLSLVAVLLGLSLAQPAFKWKDFSDLSRVANPEQIGRAAILLAALLIASLPGAVALGARPVRYSAGFAVVFGLAWAAQVIAGNSVASYWGIEYVIFALLLGLAISNGPGTPAWLAEAARTEYFIKTGLVIMGATLLFGEILEHGARGIVQAILVITVIWYVTWWLAKRLRVDDEFAAILSSAVSICGVSAAIAACGAVGGDKRKLSYVASVVLIVAVPMIVLQPWIVKAFAIPDVIGGAWLGGTLDTTGSVVAAGALISETAMKVGTVVKFSQNVLIGFAAFALSVWWAMRSRQDTGTRPSLGVIWERFPKFVLGFLAASMLFSFVIHPATVTSTKSFVAALRTWWFALAFVSIGLETRFTDIVRLESGRPLLAFLGGQTANLIWTLIVAWIIFGGWLGL